MALSLRAKNLLVGGGLATFAGSVFAYTVFQMNKDDFDDLDDVKAKVNVHQSGAIKVTPVKKD